MFFAASKWRLRANIRNMGVSKTIGHIQIKIKMLNPSQETPASSKAKYQNLKDRDTLCTFKIKIEGQNLDNGCIKDPWLLPNQDQYANPQSVTSRVLWSPIWGLKGHGYSLHLQNQDRGPKFGSWLYKRPVTIGKSRSRCQNPFRNFKNPWKPKMRT